MSGPVQLPGGALFVPGHLTAELRKALAEVLRMGGTPSPPLRALFEAAKAASTQYAVAQLPQRVPQAAETLRKPAEMATDSSHLSVARAAVRLGLTDRRVRQLLSAGVLAGRQVGARRRWLVDRKALDEYREGRSAA